MIQFDWLIAHGVRVVIIHNIDVLEILSTEWIPSLKSGEEISKVKQATE